MSEAMHPYLYIGTWDEESEEWRDTRNADAADAYFSEPCACGHCPACDDDWQPTCPRCGRALRVEWINDWGSLRCPEHGSQFVEEGTDETPERETVVPTHPVSSGTSAG